MEVDDSNNAGIYQATLAIRRQQSQPAVYLDDSYFYNWKCVGSLTHLPRGNSRPKLERMGIPNTILVKLTSTMLTEIPCLVCRILYDTNIQDKGIPHYVPETYRNVSLTADMAMEKIRLI